MRLLFPVLALSGVSALFAATLTSPVQNGSLVVYNAGLGLVHEERSVEISQGEQALTYPGVATTVQTDSVSVDFPEGVTLYSQQYRYDKITLNKIVEAHIGKNVRFVTGPKEKQSVKSGTLLAADPAVVKTADGIVSGMAQGDFIFTSIPDELIMQPSLVWNVRAEKALQGSLGVDYLISDIGWKSDYILTLDKDRGDLSGWITVDNRSGKRFEKVRLNVLAGEINRARSQRPRIDAVMMERGAAAPEVEHLAHEGYHFYAIPFKVTLANNEKTQIKYIDETSHALVRLYDVEMQHPFSTASERKMGVNQHVELSPFKMPLPGGVVRTYSQSDGTTLLLGETRIENTPKNEKIKLRLGTNFDIVAKNSLVERHDDKLYYGATVAYSLSNRSNSAKTVEVRVPGVFRRDKNLAGITTDQPYRLLNGYSIAFDITLKAGESKTWQARYKTKR